MGLSNCVPNSVSTSFSRCFAIAREQTHGEPFWVSSRTSFRRQQVSLGPSFTGAGYFPVRTPSHHVDFEIGMSSRTSCRRTRRRECCLRFRFVFHGLSIPFKKCAPPALVKDERSAMSNGFGKGCRTPPHLVRRVYLVSNCAGGPGEPGLTNYGLFVRLRAPLLSSERGCPADPLLVLDFGDGALLLTGAQCGHPELSRYCRIVEHLLGLRPLALALDEQM